MLSSHYQGTDFDPYSGRDTGKRGMYRSIGINRTGVTTVCQIRERAPEEVRGLVWLCFGSTTFSSLLPVYPQVASLPDYLSRVELTPSTENFYWSSRLIGALADPCFASVIQEIDRSQEAVAVRGRQLVREYDRKIAESGDASLAAAANEALCRMAREETGRVLGKVLLEASRHMKNGFSLADH